MKDDRDVEQMIVIFTVPEVRTPFDQRKSVRIYVPNLIHYMMLRITKEGVTSPDSDYESNTSHNPVIYSL